MDFIDQPLSSRLVCPAIRTKYVKNRSYTPIVQDEDRNDKRRKQRYLLVDNSYHFSIKEDDESPVSHNLLPLIGCNNKETQVVSTDYTGKVGCGACWHNKMGTTYYFCEECDKWYHKECVESPPMFKSPYHPKHSLQLYKHEDNIIQKLECHSCRSDRPGLVYNCSICNFNLDPVCVRKPPFINHKKRHEHTLHFFPRKSFLICDVCGLDDDKFFIFLCLHCDFVVHINCIYLPNVIKISPHKHRLSFTSLLPPSQWICRICRKIIDRNYGAYFCKTNGCSYGVHSKCATRPHVWDGKELEGEPEDVNEGIIKPPFEEISDGIIVHFSHSEHPMQRNEDIRILYDEKTHCQACMLPLYVGKAYTCMRIECDYVLHEACAYFSRVKQHPLHAHSLTLEPSCTQTLRYCGLCYLDTFGFKYMCHNGCENLSFDARCASISEPYVHHSHCHPLFVTKARFTAKCSICKQPALSTLNCDECGFLLCIACATLPYKVRYKNDEHLLTFTCEKDAIGIYWCDLCEETINSSTGFYMSNECEVTFHTECLLGEDLYMNPSSKIRLREEEFTVVHNSAFTRPICSGCRRRCQYKIMFIASSGDIYCSIREIYLYRYKTRLERRMFLFK